MGIGSYKEAERYRMRRNKNLTRTFYLDTKRTLDDEPFAWEQVQNTPETDYETEVQPDMVIPPQDVLPKNSEPVMPWAPGIPDPQFRQLELAEGGRVGFGGGGSGSYERKIPEDLQKKLDIAKDEINKRNQLGILSRAEDIGKISNIDKGQINVYIRKGLLPSFITKEEAVVKYFNNAIENNSPLKNFKTQNILDYLNHEMPLGSKGRIAYHSLLDILNKEQPELYDTIFSQKGGTQQLITKNKRIQDLPIKDYLRDPNLVKAEQAILSSSISSKRDELRILEGKLKLGPKDFAISQAQDIYVKELNENIKQQVKEIGYDEWVKRNPNLIEYAGKRLENGKIIQRTSEELKKYIEDGFFSIDHKNKKSGEKINIEFPTNKQVVPSGINSGYIRSAQTYLKNNIDQYGKDLNITRNINNIINEGKKFNFTIGMDEVPNYQGSLLFKNFKGIKNIGGTQTPTVFENTLTGFDEQLKQFNLDTSNISKNITIPTEEAFGETKTKIKGRTQDIEDVLNKAGVTNEEKKAINVINQLNFGADPNLVKELYGKEINLVKNAISKIPAPVKAVGKVFGLADVALDAIFALPYLATGDIEGAKRSSTAGLFGWGKSIEEELLEQTENKESVQRALNNLKLVPELRGLEKEKQSLEKYLKNPLDEEQSSIYFENLNSVNQRIKNIQDTLGKKQYTEEDQKVLLDTVNKLAASKVKQTESWFGPELKQAQGPTLQQRLVNRILEEEGILESIPDKALQEAIGKITPIEIPEIQSPDDSMREGFKKGGMSKRGFLKLLGGTAATGAIAPDLIKAIKGGKKATQVERVASKLKFEKAEGMYSWFPDLVEKIKVKGKPFEEKDLIMEASYKHQAKEYGGLPKGVEKLTKHVDGDTEFILREYPDGRIAVDIHSPRNQEGLDTPVTLYYRPTMELDYYNGKKIVPAEFKVLEKEPRYFANGPDDVDIEMTEKVKVPGKTPIYGDVEAAERFATGDIKNRKVIPIKQSRRDQMTYEPVDFIEETSPYGPVYD